MVSEAEDNAAIASHRLEKTGTVQEATIFNRYAGLIALD
jgi:hypothetical protein